MDQSRGAGWAQHLEVGASSDRVEMLGAGRAARGSLQHGAGPRTCYRETLSSQRVIIKQVHSDVGFWKWVWNQINKLSQLLSPHSHSVYLLFSLLSLLLPSHMKKIVICLYSSQSFIMPYKATTEVSGPKPHFAAVENAAWRGRVTQLGFYSQPTSEPAFSTHPLWVLNEPSSISTRTFHWSWSYPSHWICYL